MHSNSLVPYWIISEHCSMLKLCFVLFFLKVIFKFKTFLNMPLYLLLTACIPLFLGGGLQFMGGLMDILMIVYLHCSTNSKASTVLQLFEAAVGKFGLPSRVRSDKEMENVDVAWFMLSHPLRGPDRGSHIAGRNVHNQLIERLWRDLFIRCTYIFYNLNNS